MIRVRLQIGDGEIRDTYEKYGLMYLASDNRTAPPIKGFATSTYAEDAGEYIDPRTVDDAFDYKVKFCIETPNRYLTSANAKIKQFNDLMYKSGAKTATGRDGVKTFTTFTFYNDYKRTKIVGIPQPLEEIKEDDLRKYTINGNPYDFAIVELTIRVNDPSLCSFNLLRDGEVPIEISLSTDGTDIYVKTSRELEPDEYPILLRKGSAKKTIEDDYNTTFTVMRHHKWQIYYDRHDEDDTITHWPFMLDKETSRLQGSDSTTRNLVRQLVQWKKSNTKKYSCIKIRKSQHSNFILPLKEGVVGRCCFGVAIYSRNVKRLSNVCYFRSNVRVTSDNSIEQWLSV